MKMPSAGAIIAAIFAGIPAAIGGAPSSAPRHMFEVTSYEYTFQSPDKVEGGVVTVRLVNRGKSGHQVALARLDDSSSLKRVMRTLVDDKQRTTGIKWIGGVESALPGDSSETTLVLKPGQYVIVCSYDGPTGHAHVSMGMIRPLTVATGAGASDSMLPAAATTIRLTDYHVAVAGRVRAGRQLVRVQNDGAHFHHLIFSRIVGNATIAEIDKWDGKSKPAPLDDVSGGAAVLSPGQASVIALNLKPGRYLLGCILSDAPGAKPHYLLGMEQEIIIQ